MKFVWAITLVFAVSLSRNVFARGENATTGSGEVSSQGETPPAQQINDAASNQWFTGSLESPSPALSEAGVFAIEPYGIYTGNTGTYDTYGRTHSVSHGVNQIQSLTLLEYSFTNRLTLELVPTFSHSWNDQTTSSFLGAGDLPVELKYRVNDQNNKTGFPSVTLDLGMSFPTGAYDRLRTGVNGLGSGAYTAEEGVLVQSLFSTWADHPLRLRLWGDAYQPVANVSVRDLSVYGTTQGFQGHAAPGFSAQLGASAEYGLDQRWVLAFDVVQDYADGFHLKGTDETGNRVNTRIARTTSLAVAPAVEYNWSDNAGFIAGVELSVAGHNSSSYVAPQFAFIFSF